MTKGRTYPGESTTVRDPRTGALVRQVTSHPSIHHQPFFFIPAYDDAMARLVFVSYRTGTAQVFAEDRASGDLVQLTDRAGIDEWSIYPSRDGRFVLFIADNVAVRLDLSTLNETELADFRGEAQVREGMVASGMGTTALSWDNRWWAVPVKVADGFRFYVIDTETGAANCILERDVIGHPQFCPDDPNLILYMGPHTARVWVVGRDGSDHRMIYSRDTARNEWVVHESWIPGRREISFVDWPNGVWAIDVDTGKKRKVCSFNAWHPMCSPDGTRMVCDTNFPDDGLRVFDPRPGGGTPDTLCFAGASQMGTHWAEPFPYAKGPVKVYAPQHTHPHPSLAPDMSRVVFTSDCSGHAQVYECMLNQGAQ